MRKKTKINKILSGICMLLIIYCSIFVSVSGASQLVVDTNRMVVLDDPNSGTAASGFFNPSVIRGGSWNSNYWSGEATTIRATALTTNNSGSPVSGITVNFNLKNPAGASVNTVPATTNAQGVAYYSFDLNAKNYWGNWKIDASAIVDGANVQSSASFTSNWWGCTQCHNDKVGVGSGGITGVFGSYTAKSYYTMGADFHKNPKDSKHSNAMAAGACTVCHQSYNGTATNWGFSSDSPTISSRNEYSPDWHNNKVTCQGCHQGSNVANTRAEVAGCYDTAGCHAKKNANVKTVSSTTGYVVGGNYKTKYSAIPTNAIKSHTVGDTTECIVCHSAGHNITKPYNVLTTSNANTENDQCWACHTNRLTTHKSNSNCVSCHTQDAHNVSTGGGGPDCKSCHPAKDAGVHTNINSVAVASGADVANKACWGCHQTGGIQPTDMGDKSKTPYQCADCHGTNKPYPGVNNAPTIDMFNTAGKAMTSNAVTFVTNAGSIPSRGGGLGHGTTVQCLDCHNSAHAIAYIQPDGTYGARATAATCIDCHQTGTVGAANLLFDNAYVLGEPLHHSNDPNNGSLWKRGTDPTFWNSQLTGCLYCHGSVIHSLTPIGKPLEFNDGNNVRQFGTWCASCHYKGYSLYSNMTTNMIPVPPEITRDATYGNYAEPPYYDHSGIGDFNDTTCNSCHGGRADATSLMHNTAIGGGGADCVACHDIGNSAPKHVNVSAMNGSDSIHKDLNKDVITDLNPDNKRCWSCHGDGSVPTKHPDAYKNPATCVDCHVGTNANFTPSNTILKVSQHYWNGVNINTTGVSSCYTCHNKSGMMIVANDPDLGTINGGLNTGDGSTSHYGKKRGDLVSTADTSGYCNYCHNSTTGSASFFDTFVNVDNRNIQNHSRYGTNPKCQDCHATGRIHNFTVTGFGQLPTLPSVFCLNCHGPSGTAAIKNKFMHNGTVECAVCHLDTGKDIHPVKYLNSGGTFVLSNATGVKCTDCHESGLYGAPAVGKVQHSSNPLNGSLWNFGRPSIFWNGNSPNTECLYCHGETKHSVVALGKLDAFKGTNVKNVSGTWCGLCHYQGNGQYNNMISVMNLIGIPPEISSNTTYGNYPSGAADGTSYFNHALSSYNDDVCDNCHYAGTPPSLTKLMHNTAIGGTSCMGCHPDVDAVKLGGHINVNTSDTAGILSDNDCKTCHYGVQTLGQMLVGYANHSNTYFCQDCHTTAGTGPVKPDPSLFKDGTQHGAGNCENCHIAGDNEQRPLPDAYKYHANGPKGPATGKTCYSCHYRTDGEQYPAGSPTVGLNDAPFNAPGEDHECISCHSGELPQPLRPPLTGDFSCGSPISCHAPGDNHSVGPGNHKSMTVSISGTVLTNPTVSAGNITNVTAMISNNYAQIAKAQYRIMNSAGTIQIRPWTNMNASDGRFGNKWESATGRIDTTGLAAGTYSIQVKGMVSDYRGGTGHNPSLLYYPDNGAWTSVASVMLTVNTPGCNQVFTDVSCASWAYPYVMDLYGKGIVSGIGGGLFAPDNTVTRAQFAKMATLGAGVTYSGSGVTPFTDVPPTSWAYPYVMAAREHGIINGYIDGTFHPDEPVTRAQMAKMVTVAAGVTYSGSGVTPFTDVSPAGWEYPYVMAAREYGIINGYVDGTFHPDEQATRAQASKMVSVMMTIP